MNNSSEKKSRIPEAPVPAAAQGNLLSSVAPPLELPNFITTTSNIPASQLPPQMETQPSVAVAPPSEVVPQPVRPVVVRSLAAEPQPTESFSPVIPLIKGEPTVPIRSPDDSQAMSQSPVSLSDSTSETERIGDIMPGSGIFTWVKGAVSTGGILHRVAEKAKSSVDSMITTLDPQMKEYLNSGGDMHIVVASDKDVKISPIREAFQAIFGKANVVGLAAQSDVTAAQPVGYAAAYASAKQRIAHIRANQADLHNNVPIVAVESYLHEAIADRWFDIGLLVLSLPSLGIELQLQTQGTPVPAAAVAAMRAATQPDYTHIHTGFEITLGSVMSDSLQVPHTQWHEAVTGVSRRELLVLAAKSLAGSYKRLLAQAAAES